jgi:hypothetical protein
VPQSLPWMVLWASSLWLTGLVISCSFSLCIWAYTVLPGRFLPGRGSHLACQTLSLGGADSTAEGLSSPPGKAKPSTVPLGCRLYSTAF